MPQTGVEVQVQKPRQPLSDPYVILTLAVYNTAKSELLASYLKRERYRDSVMFHYLVKSREKRRLEALKFFKECLGGSPLVFEILKAEFPDWNIEAAIRDFITRWRWNALIEVLRMEVYRRELKDPVEKRAWSREYRLKKKCLKALSTS